LSERWFPSSPPLTWRAARWHYEQGHIAKAAQLLQRVVKMGESNRYDHTISFDQRIFHDETRLNLGVCYAKLGQPGKALEQFRLINPRTEVGLRIGSDFHVG